MSSQPPRRILWPGARVVALVVALFGAYGVISSIGELWRTTPPSLSGIPNPVFGHPERPATTEAITEFARQYRGNFGVAAFFSFFLVLIAANFFHNLTRLFPHAPIRSVFAGVFLGAAVLCGFLVVLSVLKISELALQALAAGGEQEAWLRPGMNLLFQLHVVYGSAFFLCMGWGWFLMGTAMWAVPVRAWWTRSAAAILLLAGLVGIVVVLDRAWLPTFGAQAPSWAVFLSREAFGNTALVWALLASGIFGWFYDSANQAASPAFEQGTRGAVVGGK